MKNMKKKNLLLLISVAVLLLSAVGATVAYLTTQTTPIENTFTPANVGVEVTDKISGLTKSDIKITNTSDFPVYMRVAVVGNWWVGDEIVAPWTDYSGFTSAVDSSKWENDGIYYYYKADNGKVASNTKVDMLPANGTYTAPECGIEGATLKLNIMAQVIQYDGISGADYKTVWTKAAE